MHEDEDEEYSDLDNRLRARMLYAGHGAMDRIEWHRDRGTSPILFTTYQTAKAAHWRRIFEDMAGHQIIHALEHKFQGQEHQNLNMKDIPDLLMEVYKIGFSTGRLVEEMNVVEIREEGLLAVEDPHITLPGD